MPLRWRRASSQLRISIIFRIRSFPGYFGTCRHPTPARGGSVRVEASIRARI